MDGFLVSELSPFVERTPGLTYIAIQVMQTRQELSGRRVAVHGSNYLCEEAVSVCWFLCLTASKITHKVANGF